MILYNSIWLFAVYQNQAKACWGQSGAYQINLQRSQLSIEPYNELIAAGMMIVSVHKPLLPAYYSLVPICLVRITASR